MLSCFLQGKTFSVWKLNDLHNLDVFVSLLLFGEVHKEHWKTETGTVIGLLNANPMKQKDGYDGVSGTLAGSWKLQSPEGTPATKSINNYYTYSIYF